MNDKLRNTNSGALSRRDALKLGVGAAAAVTVFGLSGRIVMAQEGQVLKVANPAFS